MSEYVPCYKCKNDNCPRGIFDKSNQTYTFCDSYIAPKPADSCFADCHIWEPGDKLDTLSDKCDVLIKAADIKALVAQPTNEPLTLEQLQEMDGEPVWIYDVNCWAIVAVEKYGQYANIPFAVGHFHGVKFEWDILERKLVCYRHKPEGNKNDG